MSKMKMPSELSVRDKVAALLFVLEGIDEVLCNVDSQDLYFPDKTSLNKKEKEILGEVFKIINGLRGYSNKLFDLSVDWDEQERKRNKAKKSEGDD